MFFTDRALNASTYYFQIINAFAIADPTLPNPPKKLKNLDPTRPDSTQPMGNKTHGQLWCSVIIYTLGVLVVLVLCCLCIGVVMPPAV